MSKLVAIPNFHQVLPVTVDLKSRSTANAMRLVVTEKGTSSIDVLGITRGFARCCRRLMIRCAT